MVVQRLITVGIAVRVLWWPLAVQCIDGLNVNHEHHRNYARHKETVTETAKIPHYIHHGFTIKYVFTLVSTRLTQGNTSNFLLVRTDLK